MQRSSKFRRMIGTGLGAVVLGVTVVAMAAPAGAADGTTTPAGGTARHRVHLTTDQKQCLASHGVTRPIRPLTKEKIATIQAAAKACNLRIPRLQRLLTAEQKQCLASHGVTRPIRPLTKEKVATIRAAAKACDVKVPLRRHVLTAAQKQCLVQHGVTRPIRPLTPEKVQTLKTAAQACGITLPKKMAAPASA
jgi:hypothetical protein